jgi:hypothetical protein
MTNDKSPMTNEFPNPKHHNRATISGQGSRLEFRAWSLFGHLTLVIGH